MMPTTFGKKTKKKILKVFYHRVLVQNIVLRVKPTRVEAKPGDVIEFNCQENSKDVLVHITKRVNWKHVANDGRSHKITDGFSLDSKVDSTKYSFSHGPAENSDTKYSFRLKILGVGDDDDGKYVCENEDSTFTVLSSKEVRFTVVYPVQKVEMQLLSITTGRKMYSETQIIADSDLLEVIEGEYEVTCTAVGSNPKPQMALMFNNNLQQVETTMEKSLVGNRPSYKGMFRKVFRLRADKNNKQTIVCSGGIPRHQFPDKYAVLYLMVFPVLVVPEVECDNVSAQINYQRAELTCRFHSTLALDCSLINWVDSYHNVIISPRNEKQDPGNGDVMAHCTMSMQLF